MKSSEFKYFIIILVAILIIPSLGMMGLFGNGMSNGMGMGYGYNYNKTDSISSKGFSEKYVLPDTVVIDFSVITKEDVLKEATDKNITILKEVEGKLSILGIGKTDLSSRYFNTYPLYEYYNGGRTLTGYEVINTIKIETDKVDNVENIVRVLTENDKVNIDNIFFTLTNKDGYEQELIEGAVNNAKKKAEAGLRSTNQKIKRLYSLYIGSNNNYYRGMMNNNYMEANSMMSMMGSSMMGGYSSDYVNSGYMMNSSTMNEYIEEGQNGEYFMMEDLEEESFLEYESMMDSSSEIMMDSSPMKIDENSILLLNGSFYPQKIKLSVTVNAVFEVK